MNINHPHNHFEVVQSVSPCDRCHSTCRVARGSSSPAELRGDPAHLLGSTSRQLTCRVARGSSTPAESRGDPAHLPSREGIQHTCRVARGSSSPAELRGDPAHLPSREGQVATLSPTLKFLLTAFISQSLASLCWNRHHSKAGLKTPPSHQSAQATTSSGTVQCSPDTDGRRFFLDTAVSRLPKNSGDSITTTSSSPSTLPGSNPPHYWVLHSG